jgi:adenylate cyclase
MKLSRRSHREWRIIFWVSLASAAASAWFGLRIEPDDPPLQAMARGVLSSLVIATPIVLVQVKGGPRRLRRLPYAAFFAVKVVFYAIVIVGGLLLVRYLFERGGVPFDEQFRRSLVFAILMSVVGNLFFDMGMLLGFGTLTSIFLGRYAKPRREERTFVLIDMKDSTGLAERLGPVHFHELLNDFFRDISSAALECGAEIHKYVGDEVILTWKSKTALGDGEWLSCPFIAQDFIEANRQRYLGRFGAVPALRAASHFGEIVTGEIGDVRREIAYVGDTLNVAARLLEAAKELGRDVLVSTDCLEHAALPPELKAERLPTLTVRGRAAPLGIAALARSSASG